MRCPRSRSAITRKVRPPAEREALGKSEGDFVTTWMKNLDWSIVLCAEVVWVRRGRTRETRELAFDEAEAVCSVRTVVLWAMHALWSLSVGCLRAGKVVVFHEEEDAVGGEDRGNGGERTRAEAWKKMRMPCLRSYHRRENMICSGGGERCRWI